MGWELVSFHEELGKSSALLGFPLGSLVESTRPSGAGSEREGSDKNHTQQIDSSQSSGPASQPHSADCLRGG